MTRKNRLIKTACALVIIVSVLVISLLAIFKGDALGALSNGWGVFKTYTVESNILMAAACAVLLYFAYAKKNDMPKWAYTLLLCGTASVMVTFVTVMVFLIPTRIIRGTDPLVMIKNEMLFLHVLNPILAFALTALIKDGHAYTRKDCLIAVIPTVIYSLVYGYSVVIAKTWPDFYGFTFGGNYLLAPVAMLAMYALCYFAAALVKRVHKAKRLPQKYRAKVKLESSKLQEKPAWIPCDSCSRK